MRVHYFKSATATVSLCGLVNPPIPPGHGANDCPTCAKVLRASCKLQLALSALGIKSVVE